MVFFMIFFYMGPGCRQGDPISPYLFLLCAEIMGIMIRNINLIKGIVIEDKDYKLLQYADDTVLFMDGSEDSIRSTLSLVNQYSKFSGLKPNYDKTQCIKIGSTAYTGNNYYEKYKNLMWSQEPFTVLGVTYCIDLDTNTMFDLNFLPKIELVKKLISSWSRRILTTAGRITVVKTLLIPKFSHLLMTLPSPPKEKLKEIENLLFNYIWNNKTARIAKNIICQSYEYSGMRMTCLDSFCKSLKITWIRRYFDNSCSSAWKHLIRV